MMKHEHDHGQGGCALCRIELKNVGVTAGGDTLLSGINFHIHCGQLTALVGPNGAGKTTLLRALLQQVPHEGQIRHVDAHGHDFAAPRIGYVPQQLSFDREMPLTVEDLMAAAISKKPVWLGIGKKTKETVHRALKETNAESLANKRLGTLSGGEMQRVLLAMALMPLPDLLVLDEPVSGMDQNGLSLFLQTVDHLRNTHHMAILMVSHDWQLVQQYADYVVLVNREVLCAGTPKEVFMSQAFKDTFQVLPVMEEEK